MNYLYSGSFIAPTGAPTYADGRDACDAALRKILSRRPCRPDSLAKRGPDDSDVNGANAQLLTKQQRALRSNAHEALDAIRDIHSDGPQRVAPVAEGDAAFRSKSVAMVKSAQAHGQPLQRSGYLPDPETVLNKRLAKAVGSAVAAEPARKTLSSDQWRRMTWQQRRDYFAKDAPRLPPQDSDITNGGIANTGATNNWRDQTEMGDTLTTRIGSAVIGVPSQSNREAALAAIKRDLSRPKRMLARTADE